MTQSNRAERKPIRMVNGKSYDTDEECLTALLEAFKAMFDEPTPRTMPDTQ